MRLPISLFAMHPEQATDFIAYLNEIGSKRTVTPATYVIGVKSPKILQRNRITPGGETLSRGKVPVIIL